MSDEAGVPLAHYIDHHPVCGVLLTCMACYRWESYSLDVVVQRLTLQGVDARAYPISSVGKHARKPCKECGATRWESRPNWNGEQPQPVVKATDLAWEFTSYSAAKRRV